MRPPDLIRAIRDVIAADVSDVKGAYYPAPNSLNDVKLPAVVLYWSGNDPTAITHQSGQEQMWVGPIIGHLLTARKGNTPQEFARVDDLIVPIVDAFGLDAEGRTAIERHPELFGYGVYQCLVTGALPTQSIPFAGQDHYGAELTWTFRLDRATGSS